MIPGAYCGIGQEQGIALTIALPVYAIPRPCQNGIAHAKGAVRGAADDGIISQHLQHADEQVTSTVHTSRAAVPLCDA